MEKYDRQAEQLRQIRDEERNSISDRKEANDNLLKTLDEMEISMLKQADAQVAAAQANVAANNSIENQVALIDALSNKQGVLAPRRKLGKHTHTDIYIHIIWRI